MTLTPLNDKPYLDRVYEVAYYTSGRLMIVDREGNPIPELQAMYATGNPDGVGVYYWPLIIDRASLFAIGDTPMGLYHPLSKEQFRKLTNTDHYRIADHPQMP